MKQKKMVKIEDVEEKREEVVVPVKGKINRIRIVKRRSNSVILSFTYY